MSATSSLDTHCCWVEDTTGNLSPGHDVEVEEGTVGDHDMTDADAETSNACCAICHEAATAGTKGAAGVIPG